MSLKFRYKNNHESLYMFVLYGILWSISDFIRHKNCAFNVKIFVYTLYKCGLENLATGQDKLFLRAIL